MSDDTEDKDAKKDTVAEVILGQMTDTFIKYVANYNDPKHDDVMFAVETTSHYMAIAQQLARLHGRLDYITNQLLGSSLTPEQTAAWLKTLDSANVHTVDWSALSNKPSANEVAHVQWVGSGDYSSGVQDGQWRYTIHRAGNSYCTGWISNIGRHVSDDQLREAIRVWEAGFSGHIFRDKDKQS